MLPTARLETGTVFAHDFRIVRPLAEGGMGAVYIVEQVSTRKRRALKVLRAELTSDARSAARFVQEATVGANIQSEHVVEVLGAGVDPATRTPWLVMELLDGEELTAVVARHGRLAPAQAHEICRQLCHGVAAAHAAGVVHRDLKPENVFVARSRRADVPFTVKVLDFGIAKVMQEVSRPATTTSVIGSPLWMAPEQIKAERVSPATDVWALGLIAFWLLTGENYWLAAHAEGAVLQAILAENLFAALEPATTRAARFGRHGVIPPGFDAWLARCLERDPSARFGDAGEAFAALAQVLGSAAPQGYASAASPSLLPPARASMDPMGAPAPTPVLSPPGAPSHSAEAMMATSAVATGGAGNGVTVVRTGSFARGAFPVAGVMLLCGVAGVMAARHLRRREPREEPRVEVVPPAAPAAMAWADAGVVAVAAPDAAARVVAVAVDPAGEPAPGQRAAWENARTEGSARPRRVVPVAMSAAPAAPASTAPASASGAPSRPMPSPSSRTAAIASLEDQAERNDQLAASATNPNAANAYRQNARSMRASADAQIDATERQARAMMATEPGNAGVLLSYVREARDYLRARRARHP